MQVDLHLMGDPVFAWKDVPAGDHEMTVEIELEMQDGTRTSQMISVAFANHSACQVRIKRARVR
jgi:hypothetical protein